MEPLSVAIHACNRAGISGGQKILVLGAGPIGLMSVLVAKAYGATDIGITGKLMFPVIKKKKLIDVFDLLKLLNRII